MRNFIPSAGELLNQIWEDKDVHIVDKDYKLGKDKFRLVDFSLSGHGRDEDLKYIRSPFYRTNIRRGNTIIENLNTGHVEWARKGTPKILDIKLQYPQFFLNKNKLSKEEMKVAEIIFEQVNFAFKEGKKVELIKTEKINGQNAQVSYNYDFDAWMICSKNVSILAAYIEDLKIYEGPRYKYALMIAEQWFKSLENLKKEEIKELKKLLDNFTIVGEYSGNPDYQHLVQYDSIGIRWFAMVDNFSENYCLDPFYTKKQLEKFGFKVAKMKSITMTSVAQNFYEALEKLYLKTAEAGLEDEEYGMEGSIIYFVVQQIQKNKPVQPKAIGAGKIKTLEYRFFRKIRQKLSRLIIKRESHETLVKNYLNEITELEVANCSRAPFPQQYYVRILQGGMELVEAAAIKEESLRSRFIGLLKIVFYAIYKRISISKYGLHMYRDANFIEKVSQIPFVKYNGLGCTTKIVYIPLCLPGMFKSYLAKKIAPHFQTIEIPYTILPFDRNKDFTQQMNALCSKSERQGSLEHYYLDGAFDSESIFNIMKQIKKSGDRKSFYKFILIQDEAKEYFECDDENQYPFRLQTIIMSYLGQHQHKAKSPKLQDKADNLKLVTNQLKRNANFKDSIAKLDLQFYSYPFSQKSKIDGDEQFSSIIKNLLKLEQNDEKNEFNLYCMLILRLQKITGVEYLSEDAVNNEIEHLIKSSYPSIPKINFKKN